MRDDLDFLFKKAKRSKDIQFINEIGVLLELDGRIEDAVILYTRAENFFLNNFNVLNIGDSKHDFLIKG